MQENIRNFSIISHIDHGKSTLADRLLEITGTIPKEKMRPQYLDMMELERERGITIKMRPVRMIYHRETRNSKSEISNKKFQNGLEIRNLDLGTSGSEFILNLIDTPGHVDFAYEVSRSLAAVEGAILLVDATKGIQAQTLHYLSEARKQNLSIIPVINKIDLLETEIPKIKRELQEILNLDPSQEILAISAKFGINVDKVLKNIIEKIPPPSGQEELPLRALIFDLKYDPYKGVIAFLKIVDGWVRQGEELYLLKKKEKCIAKELGYFLPEMKPEIKLETGEIGYLATGIKEPGKVRVGDTLTKLSQKDQKQVEPLPGYEEPKPVVFASIYPKNPEQFFQLQRSLEQLQLTDPAFNFKLERKSVLGRGFQGSFLGSLHAEIIIERLKREFGLDLIVSRPQVIYRALLPNNKTIPIFSPRDFPKDLQGKKIQERWVKIEVLTPQRFLGPVLQLLESLEGNYLDTKYLGQEGIILIYETPLREILRGFYDKLKNVSEGFASLNYQINGWREANLVKLEILIAGKLEELFSQIVPLNKVFEEGRKIVKKLKQILPSQQFPVALQAKVGGKIIARETISARKKDVLAPLYGGDYTRKRKLLEKQKKGKKKLKALGQFTLPAKVYWEMMKE